MYQKLYNLRFEFFLTTQLLLLFGSLLFPHEFYETTLAPIIYLLNIGAGILMISKNKKAMWFCITLFFIALIYFGSDMLSRVRKPDGYILIRLGIYFLMNIIVTWNIIQQVWHEKNVDKKVILGLVSGYISLGFLGFFLFASIQLTHEGAFAGLLLEDNVDFIVQTDSLLYYSFITLLTIGYGEIIPVIPIAQKAAILVGLMGQFYMVIITAVVMEKYIFLSHKKY